MKNEALRKVEQIEKHLLDLKGMGYEVVFNTTASLKYQINNPEGYKNLTGCKTNTDNLPLMNTENKTIRDLKEKFNKYFGKLYLEQQLENIKNGDTMTPYPRNEETYDFLEKYMLEKDGKGGEDKI